MKSGSLRRLGKICLFVFVGSHALWCGSMLVWHRIVAGNLAEEQALRDDARLRYEQAAAAAGSAAAPAPKPSPYTLLPDADVTGTLHVLELVGEKSGVELAGMKALPTAAPGKQSFRLVGTGTPTEICTFIAAIERHERLMVVENGRVAAGDDHALGFELNVSTFHAAGGGQ